MKYRPLQDYPEDTLGQIGDMPESGRIGFCLCNKYSPAHTMRTDFSTRATA
jgi:hypothetical protein